MSLIDFSDLLRSNGMRATLGRTQILQTLACEKFPIAIDILKEKLPYTLDTVTLYRALEAFTEKGIVQRVDLQHDHAHYELVVDRAHHHHAICRSCGLIEDIEVSHATQPEKEAACVATQFTSIDGYSLEFFGKCTSCT